jgi:hypothetical protein
MPPGPDGRDWLFDLNCDDEDRRASALARHVALLERSAAALEQVNRIWRRTGTFRPTDPADREDLSRAFAAQQDARAQTVYGPLDQLCSQRPEVDERSLERLGPFAILFLAWERDRPTEWRRAAASTWSPWGTKELLLVTLSAGTVPPPLRDPVADLVCRAVEGPYRCKDWRYAGLSRRVDGEALRSRLAGLSTASDTLTRSRAAFVLDVLDGSDQVLTRRSWANWRAAAVRADDGTDGEHVTPLTPR